MTRIKIVMKIMHSTIEITIAAIAPGESPLPLPTINNTPGVHLFTSHNTRTVNKGSIDFN